MRHGQQTTLRSSVTLRGRGVHGNQPVRMVLHPSDPNTGISFLRTGLPCGRERFIEAKWSAVSMTELCTVVGDRSQASVSTIEHLMAALSGLGVDNALIEIDGAEVPIMDGSSSEFVQAIDSVGLVSFAAARRHLKVLKPVRIAHGSGYSELRPASKGFRLEVEIDFASSLIGRQKHVIDLTPDRFRRELSRARTFGFVSDVERLWQAGFALGSSLDNSVGLDQERILNPEGLRYPDEFVRHKTLDAVGDLALAGNPIIGTYRSYRGGHKMNVAVLEALFADETAYTYVSDAPVREGARADMSLAVSANFAPERN